jgi:hypothetical protein
VTSRRLAGLQAGEVAPASPGVEEPDDHSGTVRRMDNAELFACGAEAMRRECVHVLMAAWDASTDLTEKAVLWRACDLILGVRPPRLDEMVGEPSEPALRRRPKPR